MTAPCGRGSLSEIFSVSAFKSRARKQAVSACRSYFIARPMLAEALRRLKSAPHENFLVCQCNVDSIAISWGPPVAEIHQNGGSRPADPPLCTFCFQLFTVLAKRMQWKHASV
jgi:hypothetical protein